MTRLIRHDAVGPAIIKVGEKTIAVCQCGLSKNKPFCDGSHKVVQDEEPGLTYLYGEDGKRIVIYDAFPTQKKVFEQ